MAASRESLSSQCDGVSLYSPDEAAAMVSRLCEALLGVTPYAHIVHPEMEVPEASLPALQAALARLAAGEPLQYMLGYSDFLGMRLRVTPAVLIPRPETEELCRRVIAAYAAGPAASASGSASRSASATSAAGSPSVPSSNAVFAARTSSAAPRAILDLCCGSGCITWAMARAFPEARVLGVDLSADALSVAADQAIPGVRRPDFVRADVLDRNGLEAVLSDWLARNGLEAVDLLLSNPPYVREQERGEMSRNVLDFEPSMALFVPDEDALRFYRAIREVWFSPLLRPQARLALEINEALGPETLALFQAGAPLPSHHGQTSPHQSLPPSNASVCLEKDFNEKNRYIFAEK